MPPPLETLGGISFLSLHAPEAKLDLQATVKAGDFYPATWTRLAVVSLGFPVAVELPGAMRPLVTTVGLQLIDRAERVVGRAIRPILSPPGEPRLGGTSARVSLANVGTSPTLSWSPSMIDPGAGPGLAGPVLYQIAVQRLDVTVDRIFEVLLAILYTEASSIELPPELLTPGPWYRFTISANLAERSRLRAPARAILPLVQAATVTAPFTP